MQPGYSRKLESSKNSLFLIRKFNRHGQLVLNSFDSSESLTNDKTTNKRKFNHTDFNKIYLKETELSELKTLQPKDYIPLHVENPQSYFPLVQESDLNANGSVNLNGIYNVENENEKSWNNFKSQLFSTKVEDFISTQRLTSILDLLKKRKTQESLAFHSLPCSQEYKEWHSTVNELLRHYWALDRVGTTESESKRVKIQSVLTTFLSESPPSFTLKSCQLA